MRLLLPTRVAVLAAVFLLIHLILYVTKGIFTELEAEKYILQAQLVLEGRFPGAPKYFFYLPIIYLIAFAQKIGLGYGFVVTVQSCFSFLSIFLFYRGLKDLIGDRPAWLAAFAICLFVPLLHWNLYLYSESLFISISLVLFYAVCRFERQSFPGLLLILFLLTIVVFTRPFGALFVPPLFFYFLFSGYTNRKLRFYSIGMASAFILLMVLSIQSVFHGGEDMDAMKPFVEEHVVCFVPNKPEGATLNLRYYNNGITDILYYIWHNPGHFGKLMVARLFSFFKFTRPWYSPSHNLFLLVYIIPVYFFFALGIRPFLQKKTNMALYIFSLLLLYPLATTLQCDDWHSRFTMPMLPPILVVAALGFDRTWSALNQARKNRGG